MGLRFVADAGDARTQLKHVSFPFRPVPVPIASVKAFQASTRLVWFLCPSQTEPVLSPPLDALNHCSVFAVPAVSAADAVVHYRPATRESIGTVP